jgi:CelD/BcsL family acetyltransferase involved in cellulose biosynthesis
VERPPTIAGPTDQSDAQLVARAMDAADGATFSRLWHGDTTVAGAFFLAWNGTLIYKYGASDERFRAPRPNHAIFAEAIRWGCENGFHTLDLGRSDVEQPGLRAFKAGWGAIEEPLVYSRLGGAGGRRTPTPGAVAALIKRSPPWVCRALGEVFYRFAA